MKSIVQWDRDEAKYLGNEDDGCYWLTGQGEDGKWYVTVLVDCNTAHFCQPLVTDDGPHNTEGEADKAGETWAFGWCSDNGIAIEDPNDYIGMGWIGSDGRP